MQVSRRDLLRMLGLAGAGALVPSLVGRNVAKAGPSPIPKRIVFFYTEQGTLRPFWAPSAPGVPDYQAITTPWSTTNHTLGELHTPLESLKNRLLFLDGLDMVSAVADPTGPANAHYAGETHALVAANRQSGQLAGGVSIDQFIAKAINASGPVTALPSLELVINESAYDAGAESHPVYASSGEALPISGSPGNVYDRLFPNGPKGTTPEEQAALARALTDKKSVLQFSTNEYSSLAAKSSKLDRERLAAHAAAMSDLEKRMALGRVTCSEPARTIVAGTGANQYVNNADVMMRLVQTSLACDLTRVVTMCVNVPPDDLFGYQSVQGTSDFHDLVHKTNGQGAALANDPAAMKIAKDYHRYIAGMYAKLLTLLDSIPEADGSTLLDHTLVVWCGQLAGGDHSLDYLPYVLGGGMGGLVTPGRYVRYPRVADKDYWPSYSHGPAHNDLFVALANMMGVTTNTFGNAAVCKGALPALT